ncbi:MAG: hypothetical protein J5701_05460 [Bacteroidales bacterium]|nr:hypothetical protein [Bacteroidales bacterium]
MKPAAYILLFILLRCTADTVSQNTLQKDIRYCQRVVRLGDIVPDSMTLHGSQQGTAVKGKYAYMLRHGGECVVIDICKGQLKSVYQLPENTSHCNNANFGNRYHGKPLLYVSDCYNEKMCRVYAVSPEKAQLVQKIYYRSSCFPVAHDWCVDTRNKYIYVYGGKTGDTLYLKQFHLPPVNEKEVILTDEHVISTIPVTCVSIPQGSKIKRGCIFLPDGNQKEKMFLHIIQLATRQKIRTIYLDEISCEPEGVDIKGKWLYISFHTPEFKDNTLYKFKIKRLYR